jgi:hypothetical protein
MYGTIEADPTSKLLAILWKYVHFFLHEDITELYFKKRFEKSSELWQVKI